MARTAAGRRANPSAAGDGPPCRVAELSRGRLEAAPPRAENSDAIALGLIGDEWNLAIIRLAIMAGARRYKDFRDGLGIANSVLTARLRRLTEAGVFTMSLYSGDPRRYEYVLTDCGRDLWQVLLTIWSWEAVWVTEHIEPLPPMYHVRCGAGVLAGDALPGLRAAGRRSRCPRYLRAERQLWPLSAQGHYQAAVRGRFSGARPRRPDHRADRQPLVRGRARGRLPRRPPFHRPADDDRRPAGHRVGPAAHLLPDGRAQTQLPAPAPAAPSTGSPTRAGPSSRTSW